MRNELNELVFYLVLVRPGGLPYGKYEAVHSAAQDAVRNGGCVPGAQARTGHADPVDLQGSTATASLCEDAQQCHCRPEVDAPLVGAEAGGAPSLGRGRRSRLRRRVPRAQRARERHQPAFPVVRARQLLEETGAQPAHQDTRSVVAELPGQLRRGQRVSEAAAPGPTHPRLLHQNFAPATPPVWAQNLVRIALQRCNTLAAHKIHEITLSIVERNQWILQCLHSQMTSITMIW